jgi:hypothetical protein
MLLSLKRGFAGFSQDHKEEERCQTEKALEIVEAFFICSCEIGTTVETGLASPAPENS